MFRGLQTVIRSFRDREDKDVQIRLLSKRVSMYIETKQNSVSE